MSQYYYGASDLTSGYYVSHHGILKQKWGVRRFQNPDGSLTPEGKERYGVGKTKSLDPDSMTDRQINKMKKSIAKKPYDKVSDEDVALLMKAITRTKDREFFLKNKAGESYNIHVYDSSDELAKKDVNQMVKDCRYLGNNKKQMINKIVGTYVNDLKEYFDKEDLPTREDISDFKKHAAFTINADDKGKYMIETWSTSWDDNVAGDHELLMDCGYNPNDKNQKWAFGEVREFG